MAQKSKKWEEFVSLYGETARVVSYADYFARRPLFSSLQIKNTAEEAVQETFVYAWSNQEKMYESPSPENWLFKVLYYKVLERIKAEGKWSRNLRSFEQLVSVSNDADPYDRIENSLIEIISDEDYQLLKKLYIEGATYREICEEYHLTKSALGCKLHRIKQKLREKLINCFDE